MITVVNLVVNCVPIFNAVEGQLRSVADIIDILAATNFFFLI